MKQLIRFLALLAFVFLFIFILVLIFNSDKKEPNSSGAPIEHVQRTPGQELKALWVPYMSLTMEEGHRSEAGFQKQFDAIVKQAKEYGFNALIVHVRSHADALYSSKLYPWSHLLTGTQGQDPGYDPLAYMIQSTHKAGLSFHAWLNPLRIQRNATPESLSTDNPYTRWTTDTQTDNNRWAVQIAEGIYLNPAYSQTRAYIIDGIKEIVEHYDVDGIHFDDYFYPVPPEDINTFDQTEYDAYCKEASSKATPLTLLEWRTANINTLVSGVYSAVKALKPTVVFGISPTGNLENNRQMGADVKTWGGNSGYVDYLCPQIYFSFEHKTHPFVDTAKEWKKIATSPDVSLYIGLALYKAGKAEENDPEWTQSSDIIARQIACGRESLKWDGFMIYAYAQLSEPAAKQESENMKSEMTQTS